MTRTTEHRNDLNVDESDITLEFEVRRDCPMVSVPATVHIYCTLGGSVLRKIKIYETKFANGILLAICQRKKSLPVVSILPGGLGLINPVNWG